MDMLTYKLSSPTVLLEMFTKTCQCMDEGENTAIVSYICQVPKMCVGVIDVARV